MPEALAARAPRGFRDAVKSAARDAWRAGEISRWEMARINMAAFFRPEAMGEAMECVIDEADRAGMFKGEDMRADGFDWTALLDFIRELLPLILQIISIF